MGFYFLFFILILILSSNLNSRDVNANSVRESNLLLLSTQSAAYMILAVTVLY